MTPESFLANTKHLTPSDIQRHTLRLLSSCLTLPDRIEELPKHDEINSESLAISLDKYLELEKTLLRIACQAVVLADNVLSRVPGNAASPGLRALALSHTQTIRALAPTPDIISTLKSNPDPNDPNEVVVPKGFFALANMIVDCDKDATESAHIAPLSDPKPQSASQGPATSTDATVNSPALLLNASSSTASAPRKRPRTLSAREIEDIVCAPSGFYISSTKDLPRKYR